MDINVCNWSEISIRPGDLDVVGHVNNARVLELLEYGRMKWLNSQSWKPNTSSAAVVTRIEIDYIKEIGFGKPFINTLFNNNNNIDFTQQDERECCYSITLNQSIKSQPDSEDIYVNAIIKISFIDIDKRILISINDYTQ